MATHILPPAEAAKVRGCETPCWDAALAKHHHRLIKAGITAWADEGRELTRPPRPKTKPKPAKKTAGARP